MGVDAMQGSLLVDERALDAALVSLAQALQCQLGDSVPGVQILRGRCLLLKGEERNAAECFRRALELQPPGSRDTEALRCLLDTMLGLFSQKGPELRSLVDQLEAGLRRAEERHPAEAVLGELRAFCRAHTEEVAELSRALIRAGRLGLVRRLLETVQPGRGAARRPFLRSMTV